jgi:death on curing protein
MFGIELYPGVVNKASWLFYLLIKNHPFFNGNKRVAVVALFDFLKRNVRELYIDESEIFNGLFRMAIKTSESRAEDRDKIEKYLKRKIKSFVLSP